MKNDRDATKALADQFASQGDPDGWFEDFYARAGGNINRVYWADLAPGPHLVSYLAKNPAMAGARAVTIGCGLGDDAEAIAAAGYQVTAFDISPAAVAMCRSRFSDSPVEYFEVDLFDHPPAWRGAFDLVYECNTIQILTGENRIAAREAIARLVAPGGVVLVSCRGREPEEDLDAWPLALDRNEIDGFCRSGLVEAEFIAYDDDQDPPVPHYFAVYRRPEAGQSTGK